MARADDIHTLPEDLPVPQDDGAADHLVSAAVPHIPLQATTGEQIRLSELPGRTALFCYPRTGRPDEELPPGWNAIPGARGCTPEACGFRDAHSQFAEIGVRVLALSTQSPDYQRELAERGAIFNHSCDPNCDAVIDDGRISRVFYPVFPPDSHAAEVLISLRDH